MNSIRDSFKRISDEIAETCLKANRSSSDVKLVVVTKKQAIDKIFEAWEAGARFFGENYPEETVKKIELLDYQVQPEWHLIGHLQSRKVKLIPNNFNYVHSIDRVEIADKLNQACFAASKILPVLIEVNISGEESKFGFPASQEDDIYQLLDNVGQMLRLSNLIFVGLMTMPPVEGEQDNREIFRRCRELCELIQKETNLTNFREISMGTSQDFKAAILEGATIIRIGEAIMGKRE